MSFAKTANETPVINLAIGSAPLISYCLGKSKIQTQFSISTK